MPGNCCTAAGEGKKRGPRADRIRIAQASERQTKEDTDAGHQRPLYQVVLDDLLSAESGRKKKKLGGPLPSLNKRGKKSASVSGTERKRLGSGIEALLY